MRKGIKKRNREERSSTFFEKQRKRCLQQKIIVTHEKGKREKRAKEFIREKKERERER